MTRNTSQRYTLAETIEFVRRAFILDLMTAMPGEVIEYDAATRRAKVRGSFRLVLEDGTTMQRSQIHDVPVAWPQAGGYALHQDLKEGDPVLLLFMQRDMEAWKKEHGEVTPGEEGLLSEKDAVAIPGFGPAPSGDPLVPQGKASLQSQDGRFSVHIDADAETVTVKAEDSTIVVDPNDINVHADRRIRLDVSIHDRRVTIDNSAIHVQAGDHTDFGVSAGAISAAVYDGMGGVLSQFLVDASVTRMVYGSNFVDVNGSQINLIAPSVRINSQEFSTHTHSGVTTGTGSTGAVN